MTVEALDRITYRISLSFNGREFIAEVPDLPGCVGRGWSYAAALADVEREIKERVAYEKASGQGVVPLSRDAHIERARRAKGPSAIIGDLLRKKYGNLTLAALATRVGQGCSQTAFNSAVAGAGSRQVRLLIALALCVLPSQLWPERAYTIKKMDDREYLKRRRLAGYNLEEAIAA